MKTVLILNHHQPNCGVMQFGVRVWKLVKDSANVNYIYREVEEHRAFDKYVRELRPDIILYNWHKGTMGWLTEEMVKSLPNIKHYFMFHDFPVRENYDRYLFFGDYDFSGGAKFGSKKVLLPRPLLKYDGEYPENEVPTIGCFGFAFWNKGYHRLTKLVNDTFRKSVLNLHMPYSFFGDPQKTQTREVEKECRRLATNPGMKLNITHDFLDDSGVLKFLAGNDLNAFLYDNNGEGISSVIDYALSVKRPIAISDSKMFRHIYNMDIFVDKTPIEFILKNGTKPLERFYDMWNITNFQKEMDKVFDGN